MLTTSTYESDVTTLPRALGQQKSYRWQCVVARPGPDGIAYGGSGAASSLPIFLLQEKNQLL